MTKGAETNRGNSTSEVNLQVYAPSWVDRFTAWVGRRPRPSWSYYLGIGLVFLFLQAIVMWIEGAYPIGTFLPAQGFLAGAIAFSLILIHYLDKQASAALATLRPALEASEGEYHDMLYRLNTLPALPTILASLVALAFVFLTEAAGEPYHLKTLDTFPISALLLRFTYLICWWVFGALLYHTFHQLSLTNHIYTKHTHIDLFRMRPLYAFANLSALTAGSLTLLPLGWLAVNPDVPKDDPIVLVSTLAILFFAIVTFILPQLGIHRLQVAEKDRLLDETNQRLQRIITELHRRVDDGNLGEIGDLNTTMTGLEMEMDTIRRISTWPWQPETVRWLATALVLPLGLWFLQVILQRFLGP